MTNITHEEVVEQSNIFATGLQKLIKETFGCEVSQLDSISADIIYVQCKWLQMAVTPKIK